MTARNRVVREPYATWCGRTPVEIIHGLLPDLADVWDRETRPHKGEAHYAHPLKLPLWVRLAGSFGRPFLIAVRQPAILPTTLIGVSEKV